jgi:hypothetical protein
MELIILIIEIVGVVCFGLMLMELVHHFGDPNQIDMMVAVIGTISLGIVDIVISILVELAQSTSFQFVAGVMMGTLMGLHLCIMWLYIGDGVLRENPREIAQAMVDFQGSCVWIFGAIGGGVLGGLIGSGFNVLAGIVGGVLGFVMGIPFELLWLGLCPHIVMQARGATPTRPNPPPSDPHNH